MDYSKPTTNIWFPNQAEPANISPDYKQYWKTEKERCIDGFSIADGQVHISGWLYWHTVYWKIATYIVNPINGRKRREIITPYLRDVEWIVDGDFNKCEEDGRFYDLVGARDFGKSIMAASRAGWMYTFFDNSEAVITAGADNYIKLATDKIEDGLTNIHPMWKKKRLASDWKKEVRAGWKDKQSNQPHPNSSNSHIIIRNYEDGNNTMAANGTRGGFHLIDEQGTLPNLIGCVKDSDGCWWSGDDGDKPSCLTMLAGTGGDMEVGLEAAEIFFNPDAYNMLSFENPEGGMMGRFIDALMAKAAYKESQTLSNYLGINHPDLEAISILVTNKERALKEWWEPQYQKIKKSGNPKAITKFLAYWPLKPSDSFLVIKNNNYNVEAAREQKNKLSLIAQKSPSGFIGTPVELFHDGTKITHKFSDKLPITEYPLKTQSSDAPIIIYEFPVENIPWGLYIVGIDPYRHDAADNSDSLGVVYVFKRMHKISGEEYQDMFVASYAARPARQEQWNEQVRLLIKWYNAIAFCENDEMSFINYMISKGDSQYLAPVPQWLKDAIPFSTAAQNREFGVHSSVKAISLYKTCLKNYLDEIIYKEVDDKGSVIKEHLGVLRVQDSMLLEEVIKMNKDGNFDRERAASICVAAASKMEQLGAVHQEDERIKALFSGKPIKGNRMFRTNTNLFRVRKQRLFSK